MVVITGHTLSLVVIYGFGWRYLGKGSMISFFTEVHHET